MSDQITIRFYEELNDFLPENQRKVEFKHELKQTRSVKDLIESLGVPHTEIDLIITNGESVDFNCLVNGGDHISVYPVFELLDISPLNHCQPRPLRTTRFVLDTHLGRLAGYLRMLGFDTLYQNDCDDPALAQISVDEHRILLTCDRKLLMRNQISHGYFVRSRNPQKQIKEILLRFDLKNNLRPFTRCMYCNGLIRSVNKQKIEDHVSDRTRLYYNEFFQCDTCKKIYWKGSHYEKMEKMVEIIINKMSNELTH